MNRINAERFAIENDLELDEVIDFFRGAEGGDDV